MVPTHQIGRERDLVLSLSRKAAALAASDNAAPLQIISAFQRDSIKGYIYVEARSEAKKPGMSPVRPPPFMGCKAY